MGRELNAIERGTNNRFEGLSCDLLWAPRVKKSLSLNLLQYNIVIKNS